MQWSVPQGGTSTLFRDLYAGIGKGEDALVALTHAQRQAIADGFSIYEWGAFEAMTIGH